MLRFPASSKSVELLPLRDQEGQREATAWEAQRRGPWGGAVHTEHSLFQTPVYIILSLPAVWQHQP